MSEDEFVQFGEAWADCWSLYGKDTSDGVINMAFEVLRRYSLSDVTAAMTRHMNDPDAGQFFPKPADIVRNIDGSKSSQGMLAWSRVEKAIRHIGSYESLVFDDRRIHAVISDMGGWIGLCKVTDDELPFRAREFEKRYQSYVLNPPIDFPKKLIGVAEATNTLNNKKITPPVLIGNAEIAKQVYLAGGENIKDQFTRVGTRESSVFGFLENGNKEE